MGRVWKTLRCMLQKAYIAVKGGSVNWEKWMFTVYKPFSLSLSCYTPNGLRLHASEAESRPSTSFFHFSETQETHFLLSCSIDYGEWNASHTLVSVFQFLCFLTGRRAKAGLGWQGQGVWISGPSKWLSPAPVLGILRWAATGGISTKKDSLLIWNLRMNDKGSDQEWRWRFLIRHQ